MSRQRINLIRRINDLANETDALYHQASLKLGISDSVSIVLYSIYDTGESCLLSDIYKKSGINKQTVNSAVRHLEAAGVLYLQQHTGRTKKVMLTELGKDYIQKTAARLYEAEMRVFDSWTQEEIDAYVHLMEKFAGCFRRQIERL